MIYKPYQHIEKLGSSEVEGILNGTCYLSYKIDGTNSCIWLNDDGTLGFGSRKKELDYKTNNDNSKFMETIMTDPEYEDSLREIVGLLLSHPNWIIYGEWLVPVNIKTYKEKAWKHFYIFDIVYYDKDITAEELADPEISRRHENYVKFEEYSSLIDAYYPHLRYIPLIAKLENPTEEEIKAKLDYTGDYLISSGLGEGIVIKNYEYKNKYGRKTWAKVLTEDFLNTKYHSRSLKKQAAEEGTSIEYEIIKLMTIEHIFKEKSKLLEAKNSTTFEACFTHELLNRTFNEFFRDNWEIILKKFKNPTINFKVLRKLSDNKIKETLGI